MSSIKLLWILAIIFYNFSACLAFAAKDIVVKHRAVVDEKEPDLSNKIAAVIRSELAPGNLTIRCHPDKGLSVEITYIRSNMHVGIDARIRIRYQAGIDSASEDEAWYTAPGKVVLPNGRQILRDSLNDSELRMQFYDNGGPNTDMIFRPKNISVLLRKIQSDCPDDAPPPDQNGLAR